MNTLKTIATVFNIINIFLLLCFVNGLRWYKEEDRASIVGFWSMIFLLTANSVLMWV